MSRKLGWRSGESYAEVALACADLAAGQIGSARSHAETALAIAIEIEHQQWQIISRFTLGILHAEMVADDLALEQFQTALDLAASCGAAQWEERLRVWIARCRWRLGDTVTSMRVLEGIAPSSGTPTTIGRRGALLTIAEILLSEGRADEALPLIDRLLSGSAGPRNPLVMMIRAEVLASLARMDEADSVVLEARRLARRHGPYPVLWRIAASRSRLWGSRDPQIAEDERALARTELESLAATIDVPEWRDAFLQSPIIHSYLDGDRRARTSHSRESGGLTRREREVAIHVASGLTNKEIGHALSLSDRTIEMHVGNALSKLGLTGRAQLAASAVSTGIATPPES